MLSNTKLLQNHVIRVVDFFGTGLEPTLANLYARIEAEYDDYLSDYLQTKLGRKTEPDDIELPNLTVRQILDLGFGERIAANYFYIRFGALLYTSDRN